MNHGTKEGFHPLPYHFGFLEDDEFCVASFSRPACGGVRRLVFHTSGCIIAPGNFVAATQPESHDKPLLLANTARHCGGSTFDGIEGCQYDGDEREDVTIRERGLQYRLAEPLTRDIMVLDGQQ